MADKKLINFALVGCGRIAKRHSELLGNNQIKGANLVSVCDNNPSRAKLISEKFSIPFYEDFHQMLLKESIDVVVVLTHSGNHADIVVQLAKYGKHIVVEKPMALTLDDADRMIYACDNASIKLFVIKQNRFNLPVVKLREALENNRFGKITLGTIRVRWCRPQEYYDKDE